MPRAPFLMALLVAPEKHHYTRGEGEKIHFGQFHINTTALMLLALVLLLKTWKQRREGKMNSIFSSLIPRSRHKKKAAATWDIVPRAKAPLIWCRKFQALELIHIYTVNKGHGGF